MTQDQNTQNRWKSRLEGLRGSLDELAVQLNLGKAEALDAFEKSKHKLDDWTQRSRETLKPYEEAGKEQATKLRQQMESLRVQLKLGKADTEDAFAEQKRRIEKEMQGLSDLLKKQSANAGDKLGTLAEDLEDDMEGIRTQLDLMELRLRLGRKDAQDAFEQRRKSLGNQLESLSDQLSKAGSAAGQTLEQVGNDLREGWRKLRDSLRD